MCSCAISTPGGVTLIPYVDGIVPLYTSTDCAQFNTCLSTSVITFKVSNGQTVVIQQSLKQPYTTGKGTTTITGVYNPTAFPTLAPTLQPTQNPTPFPTLTPTYLPLVPTPVPSEEPTFLPTSPTPIPTPNPTSLLEYNCPYYFISTRGSFVDCYYNFNGFSNANILSNLHQH